MEIEDLERTMSEQSNAWQNAPLDGLMSAARGMMAKDASLEPQALTPLLVPSVDAGHVDFSYNAAGRLPPTPRGGGASTPRTPRGGAGDAFMGPPITSRAAQLRAQAEELKGEMRRWQQHRPDRS
eukprot:TRINITY_DN23058_c0_g3_i1.p2 TRINITY_DN23058_c0_g3~~TRINITY_DN23058_c0_g3_i1.p2  ORF type:complete len:125 (+),score=22.18 TRINITY_DN23058_c0_g3_i1:264-638(+)